MNQKGSNPFLRGKVGIFVGGILLVVAVIAFVALDGYPPSDNDTAGAIGAAQRSRTPQITPDDVSLDNPEIQMWLQNDDVQKLLRDESFQKAVKDKNFAAILENDLASKVFLEKSYAMVWLDYDLAGKLARADFANLSADAKLKALDKAIYEAQLQGPDPRLPDFATDAEWAKVFNMKLASQIVLDDELMRQAVDMAKNVKELDLAGLKKLEADAALASLQTMFAKDASLVVRYDKVHDLVTDAQMAEMFKQLKYIRQIVLDPDFALQLQRVAMRAKEIDFDMRAKEIDFDMRAKQVDQDLRAKETDYDLAKNMYADLKYAGWMRAANMSLVVNPRLPDFATDAEWAKVFNMKLASQIVLDDELMRQAIDMAQQVKELDLAGLQKLEADAALASLQTMFAKDASLVVRYDKVHDLVTDAQLADMFKQLKYVRRIVLDPEFAFQLRQVAMRAKEIDFDMRAKEIDFDMRAKEIDQDLRAKETDYDLAKNMYADLKYAGWVRAMDASLASPWSLEEAMKDASFRKFVTEYDLAGRLATDMKFMKIVAETDAAFLIRQDQVEPLFRDNRLIGKLIDLEFRGPYKMD